MVDTGRAIDLCERSRARNENPRVADRLRCTLRFVLRAAADGRGRDLAWFPCPPCGSSERPLPWTLSHLCRPLYEHSGQWLKAENKQSGVQNEHMIGFYFAMCRFLLEVFSTFHDQTPSLHLLEPTKRCDEEERAEL